MSNPSSLFSSPDKQAVFDELKSEFTNFAKQKTTGLPNVSAVTSWGAPLVSTIVLISYGVVTSLVVYLVSFQSLPEGAVAVLTLAMGSLSTLAGAVVNYWVGSSSSSARKTDIIAQTLQNQTSPPVVETTVDTKRPST